MIGEAAGSSGCGEDGGAAAGCEGDGATAAGGAEVTTTEEEIAVAGVGAGEDQTAAATDGLEDKGGRLITGGGDRAVAAVGGKVEGDVPGVTGGAIAAEGDRARGSASATTTGADGLGRDADGLITGGGDGSCAVDGDVCGIAIGECRSAHGQSGCGGSSHTTASSDGLKQQTVAVKASGEHIGVEVDGDRTGVEVEARNGAEGGGGGGHWRITTAAADGLGDQCRGEVPKGGEVTSDGEVDGAGLVVGGIAAAEGEGGCGGISEAKDGTTTTGDRLSDHGGGIAAARGDGCCGGEGDGGTVIGADDRATEADGITTSGGGVEATASDGLEDHTS